MPRREAADLEEHPERSQGLPSACYSAVDPHLVQPTLDDLFIERNLGRHRARSPEGVLTSPAADGAVRMEHCINLDLYLAPISDAMEFTYADELNTPDTLEALKLTKIIDTTAHQRYNRQSNGNPFNFPVVASSASESEPAAPSAGLITILSGMCAEDAAGALGDGDGDRVDCGGLLSPEHFDVEGVDLNEYDLLSDYQDAILNDMLGGDDAAHARNASDASDTNADSNAPPLEAPAALDEHHNYALKLNIGHLLPPDGDVLQTPDIINAILQYDSGAASEFQAVTFQANLLTTDQIKEELAYSPASEVRPRSPLDDDSSTQTGAVRRVARRRRATSDDEDYVPPSLAARRTTRRRVAVKEEPTDDDDDDAAPPAKVLKRGRPAKPVSARSSTSSECSKYREMRDKNNEASRRSRRKRRMQEQSIEEECEALRMTNVRLLASVAELEKSVALYRGNLMSLLLKKA